MACGYSNESPRVTEHKNDKNFEKLKHFEFFEIWYFCY